MKLNKAIQTKTDVINTYYKTIKLSNVKINKSKRIIKGKLSVKGSTVKIKVGKKTYKKIVKGYSFSIKVKAALKKKAKITINVAKAGFSSIKKVFKVK